MTSRDLNTGRLGSLDTLRGVAILLVVLFHTSVSYAPPRFGVGLFTAIENQGVQLFFLVSAYTMCVMWRARTNEAHRVRGFYIRRLCRIAPLYWLAILLYGLERGFRPWPDVTSNILLLHSLVPSAINSVVPGGWSIGVEVAFYILFPLIIAIRPSLVLAAGFGWFLVCGIVLEQPMLAAGIDPVALYYSPLTQFPVFLAGIYVFNLICAERSVALIRNILLVGLWIGVALAARHAGLQGPPFFWSGIIVLAVLLWGTVRYAIAVPPLQFFGRLSYSMYLAHFAVIDAVTAIFGRSLTYFPAFVLVTLGTAGVAWLSYNSGERWSQQLGRVLIRRIEHGASHRRGVPAI